MDGFLRVDNVANLPSSPTNSFMADEVASICPLITPSPPTNDLINPLPEPIEPNLGIGHELATKLQHVQVSDEDKADSASSSSSALAEPACAQLLNHRNVYHHITKDEDTEVQDVNGKTQALQLTFRNPPDNYFFMSWNWPLIRKISLWVFISGLVAMLALVIAMIYTLPKTCNPQTQWYQGNVFYEIFPARFYTENDNRVGNLIGISKKADYFLKLGVKGVRLNPIFPTPSYPHDFENVTNIVTIDPSLGSPQEFKTLVKTLKSRNISLILDLPVYPLVKRLPYRKIFDKNETSPESARDIIEEAILNWISYGVEGFYLKGLEYLVDDPNFASSLRIWKKILGSNRIIIVSDAVISKSPKEIINIVLNNVDLVDIQLDLTGGATGVTRQICTLQNGTLFSKPHMPWIHWSLSNVNSKRIANILPYGNATLGATLLQLMLPGTPSIFYGDEIGLREILETDNIHEDAKHLHQLTMPWEEQHPLLNHVDSNTLTPEYEQMKSVSQMVGVREKSPSIYMNSVYKEGVNKVNAEVKYAVEDFLVLQRWYPRRKAYVVACNLGSERKSKDLSMLLYSGEIVVGPRSDSIPGSISFKSVVLWPGESVVIELN